ncbi:hypothetical protein [Nocardia carnea]|uniref:hypothetical protein n=1 Tax=Nocardia carnea TaxID=37328 RepID=UPI0024541CD7|nr:hypothetical protein [Nocardia carnea]
MRTEIDAAAEPIPYVLVTGEAYGILLPNESLYRQPEARQANPGSRQPTVWMDRDQAEGEREMVAGILETWYGSTEADAVRVVRVVLGADGVWTLPAPEPGHYSHRPIDPDTGLPSAWPCLSVAELSVTEAREVMRGHRVCAGPLPCRIRGRARAVLARAGVMQLPSAERAARLWPSLTLPETAR